MELILAKLYLILVFSVLVLITIFLAFQINLKQNLEKKLTTLKQQTNQNADAYESQFKLGQIYLRKKLYSKAIKEFRECFTKWDKNDRLGLASLLNTLGFTYYQLKEFNIAAYYYKTALTLAPDYFTSLSNLAYLYQQQGQLQELNNIYQQMFKLAPDNKKTQELREYLEKRLIKSG
uniref:Conserved hypothetical plastid protein Ycf37 n=1 Tax=Aureoumbra lagunensis TaxID=44058 RepID=C6KJ33_9STRA|nr:conserved hypothetical plastid protein Ycf37 [Aureoumbra lagunensis]ACS36989.1 conserved hypothetical plastid protein Ycf37 [Aureoumbra lagunensis]